MNDTNDCLDAVSRVAWRCFFIGCLFLLFWSVMYLKAGSLIYWQCDMFGLTPHECSIVHYSGMGIFKFLILVFFFLPYVAIRMILHKRQKGLK